MRKILSKPPVLSTPIKNLPYKVGTDASAFGIGAVLYQEIEKNRSYIAFASKALNKAQQNYPAPKRELLAIILALNKFKMWIWGTHFLLFTDNKSL